MVMKDKALGLSMHGAGLQLLPPHPGPGYDTKGGGVSFTLGKQSVVF